MDNKSDLAPETKSAQALRQIDSMAGGLSPGIHPSTTYVRDENYQLIDARHSYGRDENPGFAVAEKVLADLEGGSAALLFSSGSSAAMAVVQSLEPGDRDLRRKLWQQWTRSTQCVLRLPLQRRAKHAERRHGPE